MGLFSKKQAAQPQNLFNYKAGEDPDLYQFALYRILAIQAEKDIDKELAERRQPRHRSPLELLESDNTAPQFQMYEAYTDVSDIYALEGEMHAELSKDLMRSSAIETLSKYLPKIIRKIVQADRCPGMEGPSGELLDLVRRYHIHGL